MDGLGGWFLGGHGDALALPPLWSCNGISITQNVFTVKGAQFR